MKIKAILASLVAVSAAAAAQAAVVITEVAPWSSGNSPVGADWFELTNTGPGAVNISGWTMDDDSNNPNSALLTGVTSIAEGESVIFLESSVANSTTIINLFKSTWFGANPPAGLQVGYYTQGVAGGVGLGTGGDRVNIFSGTAGALQAQVIFGTSDSIAPFQSFDNSAGLNAVTISTLSQVGVNNAFAISTLNGGEVGSPGVVPEPTSLAAVAGAGVLALARRRRA